ncbi:amidohydrolase [Sphingobium tyrosinilyticum]|uniref:Amidohydrolase n=1 Tax=Sphingobium tyrosinilyticum TaxID=2715436 RepID=A0ABV9EZK0_9SPHN
MKRHPLLAAFAFLSSSTLLAPAARSAPVEDKAAISAVLDKNIAGLEALYRDLHQHPELGFQEQRTAKILATKMRALGFDVTEKVGGTGIVAIYRNGAGPVTLVRTDMDALPMEEKTGLPFASKAQAVLDGKQSFVAHSCGHDTHMAWWVGTAQVLLSMKDRWKGTLVFIAQPAEEVLGGASAMLKDGLLTRFPKPDYALAAHVGGGMPTGSLVLKEGTILSASDALEIVFHGKGAHGSAPSSSIDPVVMGAHFVSDVQSVVSRQKEAATFGVITVGAFQAGSVGNIIPDEARLRLSLRSFTPQVRGLLMNGVEKTAQAVSMMAGAPAPTITRINGSAATYNDPALLTRLTPALKSAFGQGVVAIPASAPGFSGSEDFSELAAQGIPSAYLMIGGDTPEKLAEYKAKGVSPPTNHSPLFAPAAARAIRSGATALALSVLTLNGSQKQQ